MAPPPLKQEEFDVTLQHVRSTVDLLVRLHIPPTPPRITVAYGYFSDEGSDIAREVGWLLEHEQLTADKLDELYIHFFDQAEETSGLKEANRRFERTVDEVSSCIGAAQSKAERYGGVLNDFMTKADTSSDRVSPVAALLKETRDMAETNRKLNGRLSASSREITLLREHLERLEREASIDALTSIPNRKAFDQHLRHSMTNAGRSGDDFCLIMIDIDRFKLFNDNYGHLLGDQVLKLVAHTITESIRPGDMPARYGGEEFAVILPGTGLMDANSVAETIRLRVASKTVVNRRTGVVLGTITLSAGAAMFRTGERSSDLIHRADEALYQAKQTGRNRVVLETQVDA